LLGKFRSRFQVWWVFRDLAFAGLLKTNPHRCQGFRALIEPRFTLRNHASEANYDLILAPLLNDNGSVREVHTKCYPALGIGVLVIGLSAGFHASSAVNCGDVA
jgi:hypothetical protein